ncbi:hypothetical protein, variant [Aphanomyces astaci]|uniref:PUB domain-containing protein n=1 Tax=Aphanomyces astaci TaxID=112090 RepID=W4FHE1_APHAT|nr:hypothetical protein, variant [Aphanomyces astaci]ETV66932.1 hypothetical protein, variant [Aphanomyces astaci]|eukprot:XP_009843572.1 hypothetical protein, variant [Aphanomyces astaci]
MDWLKKKTKEVTSKVAKIQKDQKVKGQTFSGTGHSMQTPSAAPPPPPSRQAPPRPASADSNLSEDERMLRRQQQAEAAAKRGVPPPKKRPANVDSSVTRPDNAFEDDSSTSEAFEQAKAFEKLRIAEAGYNPYEATISSSTAARSAAVITAQTSPSRPTSRDVPSPSKQRPSSPSLPPATAATMHKILQNILDHPEDEKFHKLRLSNGAIQAKIACVPEALAFLHEIGFDAVVLDDHEEYLVLNATRTSTDTLAAAVARLQNGTST